MSGGKWAWPNNTRKAHYFIDGRSLCRKYGYIGANWLENQVMGENPGPDDCVACHRAAKRKKEE